jgi:hypothetical protein|uniref:Uncharacterized protein n=1 Tax=Eutreptiella gymnastica TaxID=73025 RepID=A0A7S4G7J5_9EUGL
MANRQRLMPTANRKRGVLDFVAGNKKTNNNLVPSRPDHGTVWHVALVPWATVVGRRCPRDELRGQVKYGGRLSVWMSCLRMCQKRGPSTIGIVHDDTYRTQRRRLDTWCLRGKTRAALDAKRKILEDVRVTGQQRTPPVEKATGSTHTEISIHRKKVTGKEITHEPAPAVGAS